MSGHDTPEVGGGLTEDDWKRVEDASWTGGARAWKAEIDAILAACDAVWAARLAAVQAECAAAEQERDDWRWSAQGLAARAESAEAERDVLRGRLAAVGAAVLAELDPCHHATEAFACPTCRIRAALAIPTAGGAE